MSKVSVVISSYNQKKRLRHCLDSAVNMKCKFADAVEIVVADDNSTDGSIELIKQYPVTLCLNDDSFPGQYTLSENWNNAVNMCTGDRVVFTNGDHVLTTWFADHHMDTCMENDIIFGPAYQTTQSIEGLVDDDNLSYLKLISQAQKNEMLLPDRRCSYQQNSAMTYNQTYTSDYPYGYNFSVRVDHFNDVGGFDVKRSWGGEEEVLCDKITEMFTDVKIKSNCNSVAIHLWHPPVNMENRHTGDLNCYEF